MLCLDVSKDSRLIFNDRCLKSLGVLHINRLHIAVQLLLGIFNIVTLATDANAKTERNTLNARLPNLLIQLRVKANVLSALSKNPSATSQ